MTQAPVVPEAFGVTVFCDDIRFETDGKFTLVGSYAGDMQLRGSFPAILPKFATSILFAQRKDFFSRDLKLQIFLPGDADDRPSVVSDLATDEALANMPEADSDYVVVRANLIFSPLALAQPGRIKVRVLRGDVPFVAGSLKVVAEPADNDPS